MGTCGNLYTYFKTYQIAQFIYSLLCGNFISKFLKIKNVKISVNVVKDRERPRNHFRIKEIKRSDKSILDPEPNLALTENKCSKGHY